MPNFLVRLLMPKGRAKCFGFTSPYHEFCREQRPLLAGRLPAGTSLTNADREKVLGKMWKALSKPGRAAYKRGLKPLTASGRGGLRVWAPTPPTTLLAGAAAVSVAVAVCAPVSAKRTAKTAPPSPDPEDQPAPFELIRARRVGPVHPAPRRACQDDYGGAHGTGAVEKYITKYQRFTELTPGCRRACQDVQRAQAAPPSPASLPPFRLGPLAPLPVVPQGGGGGEGGVSSSSESSEGELERGGQGEAGHSEGELDRMLQEQLARLRSSWYHEYIEYCSG